MVLSRSPFARPHLLATVNPRAPSHAASRHLTPSNRLLSRARQFVRGLQYLKLCATYMRTCVFHTIMCIFGAFGYAGQSQGQGRRLSCQRSLDSAAPFARHWPTISHTPRVEQETWASASAASTPSQRSLRSCASVCSRERTTTLSHRTSSSRPRVVPLPLRACACWRSARSSARGRAACACGLGVAHGRVDLAFEVAHMGGLVSPGF